MIEHLLNIAMLLFFEAIALSLLSLFLIEAKSSYNYEYRSFDRHDKGVVLVFIAVIIAVFSMTYNIVMDIVKEISFLI